MAFCLLGILKAFSLPREIWRHWAWHESAGGCKTSFIQDVLAWLHPVLTIQHGFLITHASPIHYKLKQTLNHSLNKSKATHLWQAPCLQISLASQLETRTAEETADMHSYWLIRTLEALLLAVIQCLLYTFEMSSSYFKQLSTEGQTDRRTDGQPM